MATCQCGTVGQQPHCPSWEPVMLDAVTKSSRPLQFVPLLGELLEGLETEVVLVSRQPLHHV